MKFKSFLWLFASFAFIVFHSQAKAQNIQKAKQILDAVKDRYKSAKSFKAEFKINLKNANTKVDEEMDGSIVVRGEKFYLKLPEQEVITNGRTQWTYLKEGCEVNVTDYEPSDNDITPSNIYTIYEKNYSYGYIKDTLENGRNYHIVDLKPLDIDAPFFKIRLKVVESSKSIKSWELFERNATRYTYTVTHFATVKVGDSYFKYIASRYPCEPDVIDLR